MHIGFEATPPARPYRKIVTFHVDDEMFGAARKLYRHFLTAEGVRLELSGSEVTFYTTETDGDLMTHFRRTLDINFTKVEIATKVELEPGDAIYFVRISDPMRVVKYVAGPDSVSNIRVDDTGYMM